MLDQATQADYAEPVLCDVQGCTEQGYPCVLYVPEENEEHQETLCGTHALEHGYCPGCGNFWAGVESFDFGPGLCENCRHDDDEPPPDEAEVSWAIAYGEVL